MTAIECYPCGNDVEIVQTPKDMVYVCYECRYCEHESLFQARMWTWDLFRAEAARDNAIDAARDAERQAGSAA